ncbi:MAG TPA: hypothetical protein VHU23_10770 [Rhizomicrobium sp.]|nr:hypothetical protein [Rhizomicrobium sp.]
MRISGAVSLCVFLHCAAAWAYPDLDWKLYDGMDGAAKENICFYEQNTIARLPRNVTRVWTKCAARRALDAAGADHLNAPFSRAVADISASRRENSYVPPIRAAEPLGKKQVAAAIRYEAVADVGGVAAQTTAYYEIDCNGRRVRLVSGTTGDRPLRPSAWARLPANGAGARLARLLCR